MKLYIQQKVFSFRDKFAVRDVNQNPVYYVESEFFSLGKKFHIYDTAGNEVCFIEQELFRFLPTYSVHIPGRETLTLKKEFTLFVQQYTVEELDWTVDGSFFEHEYRIHSPRGVVGELSKEWLAWGDTYELTVYEPADTLAALAVVLTIDAVNDQD